MYRMAQVGRFLLRTPLVTAVITAVAVLGGGIYVFASGNGSGSTTGEIFLEPADQLGADPFLNQLRAPVPTIVLARELLPDERKNGTASLSGGTVGLYGGTLNNSLCDRDQLTEFLTTNPGHARAWASVHDITIEQIPTFIANLTPVQLRLDTRVTNHGYLDGDATPLQSVLQAGTAVLVDRSGVPRARCACGNPLMAPQAAADMDFVGSPWSGFDAKSLLRVTPHDGDLTRIVLHDAATGTLFDRAVGTDGEKDNARLEVKAKPTTSASTTTPPFSPGSTKPTNTPTSATLPTTASAQDPTTTRAQASAVPTTVRKTTTTPAPNTTLL